MDKEARYPAELESRFDALLAAYRSAIPDVEPGPDFMPGLWRRVEASESVLVVFRRWTRGLATAAATLCLLMVLYLSLPVSQVSPVYTATYLDTLAAEHSSPERLAYAEVGYHEPDRIP